MGDSEELFETNGSFNRFTAEMTQAMVKGRERHGDFTKYSSKALMEDGFLQQAKELSLYWGMYIRYPPHPQRKENVMVICVNVANVAYMLWRSLDDNAPYVVKAPYNKGGIMSILKGRVVSKSGPIEACPVSLVVDGRTAAETRTTDQGEYFFEASDGVHHELADTVFGNKAEATVNIKASPPGYEEVDVTLGWGRGQTQEVTLHLKEVACKKGFRE